MTGAARRNGRDIRIKNAVLSKDHFSLPGRFSYSDSAGGSYFGVFIGQKKERYTIDCYEEAVVFATERQWAADDRKWHITEMRKLASR